MKENYTLILLLFYFLAQNITAQNLNESFFKNQGKKDALYEQTLAFSSEEDALDFWEDQRYYEQQLSEYNPTAYKVYIAAKKEVYLAHQQTCEVDCNHNRYYLLQTALYVTGESSEQLVFEKKKRRLKKKRD